MAESESGSGSPLSVIGSDTFTEDKFPRSRSNSNASEMSDASEASGTPSTSTPRTGMRPAKRRRTGASAYDHATPQSSGLVPPRSPTGSISSDTSGSVPTSPSFANLGPTHPLSTAYAAAQANPNDPESADYTQVTRCQWTDCPDPEQGNMDKLVLHINDVHIPPRQKKYFCEWEGCTRKSMPHTSAYALKAHMRSHTKEKPFMCSVPECDRSFTRSDALAKHMRTVHETEALRPSDPVPKGHTGGISQTISNGTGSKRLKLTFKSSKNGDGEPKLEGNLPPLPTQSTAAAAGIHTELSKLTTAESSDPELANAVDIDKVPFKLPVSEDYYPEDVYKDLDEEERSLPPSQLFRLLRRQTRWAMEEGEKLQKELEELRATTDDRHGHPVKRSGGEDVGDHIRREDWHLVDGLLDDVLQAEADKALATFNGAESASLHGQTPWQKIRGLEGLT